MIMSRRSLLKKAGISSSALIIGLQLPLKGRKALAASGSSFSHHYLMIGVIQGEYVFTMDKAEMGQGVITGQLTLICEELDINPSKVKVITAPVSDIYGTLGGLQITGGSTSTVDRWIVLRQAGANIRGAILKAASKKWTDSIENLRTDDGFVISSSGNRISYNELSQDISLEGLEDQNLKNTNEFKYIGKPTVKADAVEKSMGTAEFGMDFEMEGLLTAIVVRSPVFGGKIKSFDKSSAEKQKGIIKIIEISSGIAIIGEKYWQVSKARQSLKVQWENGPNEKISSKTIQKEYKKILANSSGNEIHSTGDLNKAFEEADEKDILEVEYDLPYLAHATMEPMNAVAHVSEDRVDIWVATQSPTGVQNGAADLLNISRDKIFVHSTKFLGGGFGRRSTNDYPLEAVELSKAIGKPVKTIWSREDDMKHSPMRPINSHYIRGLVKDKNILAWDHRIACESIMQSAMTYMLPQMLPGWIPTSVRNGLGNMAGGIMNKMGFHLTTGEGAKLDYDIPHQKLQVEDSDLTIPIHFWRSVGHSYNGFVVESFIDEMAHKSDKDSFKFRQKLLAKNPRALNVLNKVAEISQWSQPTSNNTFKGIAYQFSFNTYVAEVVEIEIVDNNIRLKKVYCAVDCGLAINPDIVIDQMKSGIIYGLSAALYGKIELENGAIKQSNFHDYPVMRINETPEIIVSIIPSAESPSGVGEPGLPPIAAALGNALFAATGKRQRSLPFTI